MILPGARASTVNTTSYNITSAFPFSMASPSYICTGNIDELLSAIFLSSSLVISAYKSEKSFAMESGSSDVFLLSVSANIVAFCIIFHVSKNLRQ